MKYRRLKGYKYQLAESFTYDLPSAFDGIIEETDYIILVNNHLIVKAGYAWDGPSGPTIDTQDFMRASLVHDCLYQLMREGWMPRTLRIEADRVFRDICRADGMSWWRAGYVYRAVRWFAGGAVKPRIEKFNEIITI